MAKNLVIVESPAKAKTINKFLGKDFAVKASYGHVRDLPRNELGVDIEDDFHPKYVILDSKKKVLKELRQAAAASDIIYIASDLDREGEAIGWHIRETLKGKDKQFLRLVFNEITQSAIRKALDKPEELDLRRVNAQQARRILDRLVGYLISPILWRTVKGGRSAGRVQSVAVRLICEREREIQAFEAKEYWSIDGLFEATENKQFKASLAEVDGAKPEVSKEAEAKAILEELQGSAYVVDKVQKKEVQRRPLPPFITSTLQQQAAIKLRFSLTRTMQLAQQLYEGVELGGEGSVGLISYMRTDSVRVAASALDEARKYVRDEFGQEFCPPKPNFYKQKGEAQDAHEAIRPTSTIRTPESVAPYLDKDQLKLYDLIWRRFVASQMTPALMDQTTIEIKSGKYLFRATGSVVKFLGFLKLYEEEIEDQAQEGEGGGLLPPVKEGEPVTCLDLTPNQHFTKPPPRYSEASLVRALEEKGIGRPSTYATIVGTIEDRDYVTKTNGRLAPTRLGQVVNSLLVENFSQILDVDFTAQMEEKLDGVEEGKVDWQRLLHEFYDQFKDTLASAQDRIRAEESTSEKCELCGSPMVIKWGRYGKFLACKGYPHCQNTKPLEQFAAPTKSAPTAEATDKTCDKCGKPMVVRTGRYGKFLACSGYPKCKNAINLNKKGEAVPKKEPQPTDRICDKCGAHMVIRSGRYGEFLSCEKYPKCKGIAPLPTGFQCPKPGCGGELVSRRSKGKRRFFGCSKYPECDFATWDMPVAEKCPKCGAPYILEKTAKGGEKSRSCAKPDCDYKEEQEFDQIENGAVSE